MSSVNVAWTGELLLLRLAGLWIGLLVAVRLVVAILASVRTLLLPVIAVDLVFHDGAVVAVLRVLLISIHRRPRLVCGYSIKGAVLATRVGAVGPRAGAVRSVRHASVDSVMRLVVAMLRVWSLLAVDLRI